MCAWAWGDSFDCYAAPADVAGYWTGYTATLFTLVAGRFAGSRAVQAASTNNMMFYKSSGVNDAVHHINLAFNQTNTLTGTSNYCNIEIYDGNTVQCAIMFRSDGTIFLKSGTAGGGGATLATYSGATTANNTWFSYEFEVVINNTTGSFKVRKNGNTVDDHSTTGINTRGGTANNYANQIMLGVGVTNACQFDDLYWRSDASSVPWIGDIRCYTRMPASDAAVQFSRTPTGVLTQSMTPGSSINTGSTGFAFYTAFTAAYSGTVTATGVSVGSLGTSTSMKCAIFADNGSGTGPGAILASALSAVTPTVGTNAFTFTGVPVVKGVLYWVGSVTDGTAQFTCSTTNFATGCRGSSSIGAFPQASPVVNNPQVVMYANWTYTATPANWQAVAEAQQDATTSYVYDSVVGHSDLYGIAAIASTPLTTYAVTTRAYMIKSDAGTRTAAVQLKSGSSTVASPTVVLTPSNWQWAWRHDTVDPATSSAWTAAAVNIINVGPVVIA